MTNTIGMDSTASLWHGGNTVPRYKRYNEYIPLGY